MREQRYLAYKVDLNLLVVVEYLKYILLLPTLNTWIIFVYKIPYRRAPRLACSAFRPSASREQRYLAYKDYLCFSTNGVSHN